MKFKEGDLVQHAKTHTVYRICGTPEHDLGSDDYEFRIESTGQPAYAYVDPMEGVMWVRSQEEMEDGRFVNVGHAK